MCVRGRVTEASAVAPKLTLTRKISTKLGANDVTISDTIENEGHTPSPFMMLYHFNFGFPVVSGDTVLLSPTKKVLTIGREKVAQPDLYRRFQDPVPGAQELVFWHEMVPDADGYVTAILTNKGLNSFGVYVRYRQKELFHFFQWKRLSQGAYVVGLEPANCWVEPRSKARERRELNLLEPGQIVRQDVIVGVCPSPSEFEELEKAIPSVNVNS
jgi:galactose mutarotase-like enzyme